MGGVQRGPLIIVRDSSRKLAYRCLICGAEFYDDEHGDYERHVVSCSDTHFEELRGMSLRAKAPALFDPEQSGDVEFQKWVRANKRAILDGSLKMK